MSTYLFNFLAVRNGGTANFARGFISAAQTDRLNNFVVLLGTDQRGLSVSANNLRYIFVDGVRNSLFRFIIEQFYVPWVAIKFKCEAVYNPFDVCQLLKPVPVLLGMKNPSLLLAGLGYYDKLSSGAKFYHKLRNNISRLSSQYADGVIFPTEYFKSRFLVESGALIERHWVVHHGCIPIASGYHKGEDSETRSEEEFLILTASVLYRYKNIHVIVEALKHLTSKVNINIKFKIAGKINDIDYFHEINDLINVHGLQGKVEFLNFVDHDELIRLYKRANVFVFASNMETFGFPMVEALSIGCPLIVNDTQFAREICGDAAWYYDLDDPISLAGVLEDFIFKRLRPISAEYSASRGRMFTFDREFDETLQCLKAIE